MSLSEAPASSGGAIDVDDMGPVDFLVVEFPHRVTPGEGVPLFVDLVDRGVIRVLDLAFIRKDDQGKVQKLNLADLGPALAVFEGASSNLLDDEDLENAAAAVGSDCTAFVLVYENRWAAPLARAMRRGGAQLVATGRIPVQGILAALEAADSAGS
jgi:hypothetical protein